MKGLIHKNFFFECLVVSMLVLVAFFGLLCAPAHAQTTAATPMLSITRASLAAGIDYASYGQQGNQPLPDFKKAFEVGLYGAYVLTPHVTATGSGAYDVDNRWIRWRVGLRTVLWRGSDTVAR
jgi:hypothetical protein